MLSRATLLSASAALALVASHAVVQAQSAPVTDQAEWAQNYDGGLRARTPRSVTPILSQEALAATEQAVAHYRDIVGRGGWGTFQGPASMRVGARNAAVAALRQRLIAEGDLDQAAGSSTIYDSYVEAAVKRFQTRHGLNATGALNTATVTAMNVPAEIRLKQLELNIVRLRSYSGELGRRFVITNLPAALVETVEDGHVVTRHAAGVGKPDRASPIMNAKALAINFNPFWTVPASIIKKDLIPKMQKDANYLTDNKIRIIGPGGHELQPSQVNWRSDEATHYQFRQDPGGDVNSLGFVRINIANPYGVYMHDTPSKGVFGDDFRFVSSGCVRVQNVRDYVTWLLKDTPGWDRQHVEEALDSGKRIDAQLSQAVPVYWTYITAWAVPDGLVQFRDDIYNKDGLGNIPLASRAPLEPEDPDAAFMQN